MVVPIPQPHHQLTDYGNALHFVIPARKHWGYVLFSGVWLFFWVFALRSVGSIVLGPVINQIGGDSTTSSAASGFPGLFLIVWLTIWIVGGVSLVFSVLWQLAGREVAEFDAQSLKVRREMFGIGRTREYLAEAIKDMRVTGNRPNPFARGFSYGWPFRRERSRNWMFQGGLAFDYGSKTVEFGNGLEPVDAVQVLQHIRERFPQYLQNVTKKSQFYER